MNDFYSAGMYWRLKWRATYTYELEIVQLPVLEFTFNRLDIGRLNLQRTHTSVLQAMMRIIPFLTFGDEENMRTLVNHFLPYLDFEK